MTYLMGWAIAPPSTYLLLVLHFSHSTLLPPINLLHCSRVLIHEARPLGAQLSEVRPDEQRQMISTVEQLEHAYS